MPTLNWIGKDAVVRHHKDVPYRLLEPVKKLSHGPADSGNLVVQGDNLHALKALLPRYAGQVKCIYIDPPYNTGNEGWVYNDNVNSPEIRKWLDEVVGKEGEDLSRHDKWLSMMYPRLVLLRDFLREDGLIFISIDDVEASTLRLLLDEIFGKRNFIATIAWQRRTSPDARLGLSQAHDHIHVYARNADQAEFNRMPLTEEQAKNYKNPDKDPRGPWVSTDFTAQGWRPNQMYTIKTPGGAEYEPPAGRCWGNVESAFEKLLADGRMWFGKDGKSRPRVKSYLSESEGIAAWTWWTHQECGHNQEAKRELNEILGYEAPFDTPKPSRLVQRIVQIATNKEDLILDSFAGSGTTGHSVLKQNKRDGGNRKFILVEMDEEIAKTVTSERVRRVSDGYTTPKGKDIEGVGGGFHYCKLSRSPMFAADGHIREDVKFKSLAEFVWFKETGIGFKGRGDSPLIGVYQGRGIYLLYNGILKDRSVDGGNVLTGKVLECLPKHDGPKVIYAAACRLGQARLQRENIIFKQTPYALEV